MKEICTIGSVVWSVKTFDKQPGIRLNHGISRAFYDERTGEVWARRTIVGAETVWHFSPRDKRTMDLTIPLEWLEDCVPEGLLAALLFAEKVGTDNVGIVRAD